jgi:hypothetical protein
MLVLRAGDKRYPEVDAKGKARAKGKDKEKSVEKPTREPPRIPKNTILVHPFATSTWFS